MAPPFCLAFPPVPKLPRRRPPGSASRLAQLVERKTLNLVVVGSSPTVGAFFPPRDRHKMFSKIHAYQRQMVFYFSLFCGE